MSQTSKVQLAGRLVEIGGGVLRDAVSKPKVTDIQTAPPSTAAFTKRWLTDALCSGTPGAAVVDYHLGDVDNGSNARQALTVIYNDAGQAAGLPARMFAKYTGTFKQ